MFQILLQSEHGNLPKSWIPSINRHKTDFFPFIFVIMSNLCFPISWNPPMRLLMLPVPLRDVFFTIKCALKCCLKDLNSPAFYSCLLFCQKTQTPGDARCFFVWRRYQGLFVWMNKHEATVFIYLWQKQSFIFFCTLITYFGGIELWV